jgi:RNA polymerase sigma-70 factor (ECF subfamily)
MAVIAAPTSLGEQTVCVVESAAFDDFYCHEFPQLVRLAYALCGGRDVAEELAQEVMIKALARWSRVSAYDKPGAWARRVLINDATSVLRRRRAELRALVRLRAEARSAGGLAPEVDEFWATVRTLPRRQAQVLALYYGDDQDVASVAAILDIAEGTVRATLAQARDALRLRLEGAGDE